MNIIDDVSDVAQWEAKNGKIDWNASTKDDLVEVIYYISKWNAELFAENEQLRDAVQLYRTYDVISKLTPPVLDIGALAVLR